MYQAKLIPGKLFNGKLFPFALSPSNLNYLVHTTIQDPQLTSVELPTKIFARNEFGKLISGAYSTTQITISDHFCYYFFISQLGSIRAIFDFLTFVLSSPNKYFEKQPENYTAPILFLSHHAFTISSDKQFLEYLHIPDVYRLTSDLIEQFPELLLMRNKTGQSIYEIAHEYKRKNTASLMNRYRFSHYTQEIQMAYYVTTYGMDELINYVVIFGDNHLLEMLLSLQAKKSIPIEFDILAYYIRISSNQDKLNKFLSIGLALFNPSSRDKFIDNSDIYIENENALTITLIWYKNLIKTAESKGFTETVQLIKNAAFIAFTSFSPSLKNADTLSIDEKYELIFSKIHEHHEAITKLAELTIGIDKFCKKHPELFTSFVAILNSEIQRLRNSNELVTNENIIELQHLLNILKTLPLVKKQIDLLSTFNHLSPEILNNIPWLLHKFSLLEKSNEFSALKKHLCDLTKMNTILEIKPKSISDLLNINKLAFLMDILQQIEHAFSSIKYNPGHPPYVNLYLAFNESAHNALLHTDAPIETVAFMNNLLILSKLIKLFAKISNYQPDIDAKTLRSQSIYQFKQSAKTIWETTLVNLDLRVKKLESDFNAFKAFDEYASEITQISENLKKSSHTQMSALGTIQLLSIERTYRQFIYGVLEPQELKSTLLNAIIETRFQFFQAQIFSNYNGSTKKFGLFAASPQRDICVHTLLTKITQIGLTTPYKIFSMRAFYNELADAIFDAYQSTHKDHQAHLRLFPTTSRLADALSVYYNRFIADPCITSADVTSLTACQF